MGNVKTEPGRFSPEADLLILDTGLILVETPLNWSLDRQNNGDSDQGTKRMQALVASASLHDLAMQHVYVPFEEISHVKITRDVPIKAQLTLHAGEVVTVRTSWSSDKLSKDSDRVLLELLRGYPQKDL